MILPIEEWRGVEKNGVRAIITTLPLCVDIKSERLFLTPSYVVAQWVAARMGARLLSKAAADYLDEICDIRLTPHTLPAGPTMGSLEFRRRDYANITEQLEKAGWKPGMIVSNAGKDWLYEQPTPDRAYNYGWFRKGDKPIQGLCVKNCHDRWHYDYSQKLRLIKDADDWRAWGYVK